MTIGVFLRGCDWLLLDPVRRCLTAKSDTAQLTPSGHYNSHLFEAAVHLARVFAVCAVFPPLAIPLIPLHVFGYARCIYSYRTFSSNSAQRLNDTIEYLMFRRTYDPRLKRVNEIASIEHNVEMERVLKMVGDVRGQYIADPVNPNVSYYVQERSQIDLDFVAQNFTYNVAFGTDMLRYVGTAAALTTLVMPARRLAIDVFLWWNKRIIFTDIRHPITNFFLSVNEYRTAMARVNLKSPALKHDPSPSLSARSFTNEAPTPRVLRKKPE